MARDNYRLKGNSKVYIIPVGDIHVGSKQFNEEYFNYFLDTVDAIQSDKRIYLMGDLLEAANKQTGNAAFCTDMTLDEQIDYVISTFKPFKKDLIFSCNGNHCARLSKDFDLDVMKLIGKALHVSTGNQNIDQFNINGEPVTVYTAHGKGSAAHAHTARGKIIRDTASIAADIKLQGHNHRLDFFSQPVRTVNGISREYYGFTGSFLRYNGYAESMQLPILPESFQIISVNKDKIVRNNEYYIDQMKPEYLQL